MSMTFKVKVTETATGVEFKIEAEGENYSPEEKRQCDILYKLYQEFIKTMREKGIPRGDQHNIRTPGNGQDD